MFKLFVSTLFFYCDIIKYETVVNMGQNLIAGSLVDNTGYLYIGGAYHLYVYAEFKK